MNADATLSTVREYHDAWSSGDFDRAVKLLADGLEVEVPINEYPTTESFAVALREFGSQATDVRLLSAMSDRDEGMLLYDMEVPGVGTMRIVEHFTIRDGKIVRLRQIHDTAALREAMAGAVAEG